MELAAYSYDGGVPPYTGENPNLLKPFITTIEPEVNYKLELLLDETGLSTFILKTEGNVEIERQYVQHSVTCVDNYFEGTVDGLYFGGTCTAPTNIVVNYIS
jgi:hypothetical protein